MKNTINTNPNIRITVEIDDDYAKYLTEDSKKRIKDIRAHLYDAVNRIVCRSDPNNNLPIENVLLL